MLTIIETHKSKEEIQNNNNMRYSLLSNKKVSEEVFARQRSLVPSADLPYWIDCSQRTHPDLHVFNWEYGDNDEPQKKLVAGKGIIIIHGKNSGCLYRVEIETDKLSQVGTLERVIENTVSKMSNRVSFAKRFRNNFFYGLAVLTCACKEISEGKTKGVYALH